MPKARWTQFGAPASPRVVFVRGVGDVRVTAEDIETYSRMSGDPEVLCEHVADDAEANHRIVGLALSAPTVANPAAHEPAMARPAAVPRRPVRKRSWLDALLRR